MTDTAICIFHRITAVLRSEAGGIRSMTLETHRLRISLQKSRELAPVHLVAFAAALLHGLVHMALRKLLRIMARHAQIGHGGLQKSLVALVGIMTIGAIAGARRIMNVRLLETKLRCIMTACTQIGADLFQSQSTNLAMRLVARQALALLPRLVRHLSLEIAFVVASQAFALFAETRSFTDLSQGIGAGDQQKRGNQH